MKKIPFIIFLFLCGFGGWIAFSLWELPDEEAIKRYRPSLTTEVLDSTGDVLAQFFSGENRLWASLDAISPFLLDAVVVAEDDTFFQHKGLNYHEIINAFVEDLKRWRFARGASTITQQLARNAFLTRKKSLIRKLREILLAVRIERALSKQRILELYLNEVEWGDSIYGAEAASRYYFDKHSSDLTLPESALLAAMLPNPRYYNPYRNRDKAEERQKEILTRMFQYHAIESDELTSALSAPLVLRSPEKGRIPIWTARDKRQQKCWEGLLEEYLVGRFGKDRLYTEGMRVRVSLKASVQRVLDTLQSEDRGESPLILLIAEGETPRGFSCVKDKEEAQALAKDLFQKDHIARGYAFHLVDKDWLLTKARLM